MGFGATHSFGARLEAAGTTRSGQTADIRTWNMSLGDQVSGRPLHDLQNPASPDEIDNLTGRHKQVAFYTPSCTAVMLEQ